MVIERLCLVRLKVTVRPVSAKQDVRRRSWIERSFGVGGATLRGEFVQQLSGGAGPGAVVLHVIFNGVVQARVMRSGSFRIGFQGGQDLVDGESERRRGGDGPDGSVGVAGITLQFYLRQVAQSGAECRAYQGEQVRKQVCQFLPDLCVRQAALRS